MNIHCIAVWTLLLTSGVCLGQVQAQGPASDIAVRAGKLLDVRSGHYLENQLIWIEGERIKKIGSAAELQGELSKGVRVIDLSHSIVLPGLIDCHTHLTISPETLGPIYLGMSVPRQALLGARNARVTLDAGFTTVRDLEAEGYSDIALRDAINAGDVPGPRMDASGPALTTTGGSGDVNSLAPQYKTFELGVADGVAAAIAAVRTDVKFGSDVIKVFATGGILSEGDDPGVEEFSPEELRAIVETSHRLGRKVAAHAHGTLGIKDAIKAGVDSIEHGSYIDEDGIQLMKERGTYLVPTVYIDRWLPENAGLLGLTPTILTKIRSMRQERELHIARAIHEGVKIAFGTDAAVYPHGLNAREFSVMVELGMTPLEAIRAATVNAADLLGWSDRVGTLEQGKFADLIAVNGDPLADVRILEQVQFVMKSGRIVKQ